MVKGNQTQAASVAEESAKGIQKSSTRRAGERTTPQRCEPLGGMVDANVKLVMCVFAHTQAAFDVYIAGLKDRLEVWAKMFKGTFEAFLYMWYNWCRNHSLFSSTGVNIFNEDAYTLDEKVLECVHRDLLHDDSIGLTMTECMASGGVTMSESCNLC